MSYQAVSRAAAAVLAVAGCLAFGRPALAGPQPFDDGSEQPSFFLVEESVGVDRVRGVVEFQLTFSEPPDFLSVDEFGRPVNSFQYEINPAFTGTALGDGGVGPVQTVLRGDEIRLTPGRDDLRVRTALGDPDPDPASGGWGQVRGTVPLDLDGDNTLRFRAGFDLLKEEGDGVFAYRVFTTEHGATTAMVEAVAIPLPPAVWIGGGTMLAAAGGTVLARWRRSQRRRDD